MPADRPGQKGREVRIDTAEAIRWMIREAILDEAGSTDESDVISPISGHRAALVEQQTRRLQLANDREARTLIPYPTVEKAMMEMVQLFIAGLDGLANRMAGGDANQRAKFRAETHRIRKSIGEKMIAWGTGAGPAIGSD